jgi:aminoglycoside 3-N-acetyltransferase
VELDGKILLLGSDHDAVTFLHYVEQVANFPEKRVARFKVPVAEGGVKVWHEMEEFDTSGAGAHANWPDRFFARLVDGYLSASRNTGRRVGNARSYLLSAAGLLRFARPIMERVAVDPDAANDLNEV